MKLLTEIVGALGRDPRFRHGGQQGKGRRAGAKFHPGRAQTRPHQGQKGRGRVLVHQQAFQRITHAGALHFTIVNNVQCLRNIRIHVHKGVTDALEVLEHRHGGRCGNGPHQALAPARDHYVNIGVQLAEGGDGLVSGHGHQLDCVGGKPRRKEGLLQQGGQGFIGAQSFAAPAQDHGVARLEAKDGRVDGDVGSGLVDHGNDAQRDAHAAHQQAVGPLPLALGGPHGVGQGGHMAAGGAHFFHNGRGQGQPVQARGVLPGLAGRLHICGIGRQYGLLVGLQQVGQVQQGARFGFGAGLGQQAGRSPRPQAQSLHFFRQSHGISLVCRGPRRGNGRQTPCAGQRDAAAWSRRGRILQGYLF